MFVHASVIPTAARVAGSGRSGVKHLAQMGQVAGAQVAAPHPVDARGRAHAEDMLGTLHGSGEPAQRRGRSRPLYPLRVGAL